MARQLPLYKIEWDRGRTHFTGYVDNGGFLDMKVREVLSSGSIPTVTVETKPEVLDVLASEIRRSDDWVVVGAKLCRIHWADEWIVHGRAEIERSAGYTS